MRTLNLGILAHVDAGKTSLTERLLYAAGVIDAIGSVDRGNTQTDSLELERQRGITIKAAVVSFAINDITVNLIDTPGHPDFIAEVERVLNVLDGAVLVVSAVEGVQAQTRVLMRTLRRLKIPTLIFINKIDRGGADPKRVLGAIAEKLTPAVLAMGSTRDLGTRDAGFSAFGANDAAFRAALAELVANNDNAILVAYVEDAEAIPYRQLRGALSAQTKAALVHPVFLGSAITGAGIDALIGGIAELLPAIEGDADGPVSGTVFKVERGSSGEKIAYARMFSGTLRTRDRIHPESPRATKVTTIGVFDKGSVQQRPSVSAGQIAKLWGLGDIRIGDAIGLGRTGSELHHFAPPTLETVIFPLRESDRTALRMALGQLAEQDPLIDLRHDDVRHEIYVSLYGEVQKEVIQHSLAADFGIAVGFRETTVICVERPVGTGSALEIIGRGENPFLATIGFRIDPAPARSGVDFRFEVDSGTMPLVFYEAVEETARATLRQGLHGWQVTDCVVAMTHSGWTSPMSTAGDFRNLAPLVLMSALTEADTVVCEPVQGFELDIPVDTLGSILPLMGRLGAIPRPPLVRGPSAIIEGEIPAARVHELQLMLPALTRGEGVLDAEFDRYQPVSGAIPTRPRTDHDPLNRREYLLRLSGRTLASTGGR